MLLGILDRLARAFNAAGGRTPEGQQIHQDYFTGSTNALFSDSSDSEKHDFRNELTFPHPNEPGEYLFCTWHGESEHQDASLALLVVGKSRRAGLCRLRRPKNYEAVRR